MMELKEAIIHAKQVAEGCPGDNRACAYQHDKLADWLEELQRYKDLEAQGRLLVLPCKVGDTVYRIVDRGYLKDTCETDCYSCDILCPYEGREYERVIEVVPWEMASIGVIVNAMEQLGKTVFLTYEEVDSALKKGVGHG